MDLNRLSEFKTTHTLLYFLPPSSCNLSPLHKRTPTSPCLMLANPIALSQLLLVSIPSLSLDCAPKSVLSFRSSLVVVQRSFPPPIQYLPCHPSHLHSKGRKCCPGHQIPHQHHQKTPLPSTILLHLKNAGMKAVVKTKCPLLSARHCKACLNFAHAHKDWTLDD